MSELAPCNGIVKSALHCGVYIDILTCTGNLYRVEHVLNVNRWLVVLRLLKDVCWMLNFTSVISSFGNHCQQSCTGKCLLWFGV